MSVLLHEVPNWPKNGLVPFVEALDKSPEFELADDGSRAVRTLFVPWDEIQGLAENFLGHPSVQRGGGGKFIQRVTPHAVRTVNFLGKSYLYATRIQRVEPWGLDDAFTVDPFSGQRDTRTTDYEAKYGLAKVQIVYETLTYDVKEDNEITQTAGKPDESYLERYVTRIFQPSAEHLPLPTGLYEWTVAPLGNISGSPGKLVPKYDVNVTWHHVPVEAIGSVLLNPDAASFPLDLAIGTVNNAVFMGCAAGTLLLAAAELKPVRSAIGERIYDVVYRMSYFRETHQKILRVTGTPKVVSYREITADGVTNLVTMAAGKSIYDWTDFRLLFRVPV